MTKIVTTRMRHFETLFETLLCLIDGFQWELGENRLRLVLI